MKPLGGITTVMDEDGNIRPAKTTPDLLPMEGRYNLLPLREENGKTSLAMPGILAGMVNSAQDPGRALRGEYVAPEKSLEFGMNLLGGSVGSAGTAAFKPAPPGEIKSLIGLKQWTQAAIRGVPEADDALIKLKDAVKLLRAKVPPLEIEKKTGWIATETGWVRQVSDRNARLIKPFPGPQIGKNRLDFLDTAEPLKNYYRNPEVEKIAPEIGDILVTPHTSGLFGATYRQRDKTIPTGAISVNTEKIAKVPQAYEKVHGLRPIVTHEVGHGLQDIAGRSKGVVSDANLKGAAYIAEQPLELEATLAQERNLFTPEELVAYPYLQHKADLLKRLAATVSGKLPKGKRYLSNQDLADMRAAIAEKEQGAILWHGTGDPFAPGQQNFLGEFDDARIGPNAVNGQAFGKGHYLAENPRVANSPEYRRQAPGGLADASGKKLDPYGDDFLNLSINARDTLGLTTRKAVDYIHDIRNSGASSWDEVIGGYQQDFNLYKLHPGEQASYNRIVDRYSNGAHLTPEEEHMLHIYGLAKEGIDRALAGIKVARHLQKQGLQFAPPTPGVLYRVHVPDEKIGQMLDLNRPISAQPHVMEPLERSAYYNQLAGYLRRGVGGRIDDTWTDLVGKEFYMGLDNFAARGPRGGSASQYLYDLGIPGNKFLDGFSRGKGEGTRNVVLFKGKDATILGREGVADADLVHPENKKFYESKK